MAFPDVSKVFPNVRLQTLANDWQTFAPVNCLMFGENIFFNANHKLSSDTNIPIFYLDIHKIFIKHFEKKLENIIEFFNRGSILKQIH